MSSLAESLKRHEATGAVSVLGAGAFGTGLAMALAGRGKPVHIWARDAATIAQMRENRTAPRLPGVTLPPEIRPTAQMSEAAQVPVLLLAVPTQGLRGLVTQYRDQLAGRVLVACCKGVERGTGLLPTDIIRDVLPGAAVGVLTGPSFAADIAIGRPTALTLATDHPQADALQDALATPMLRLYRTEDLTGAQLGGALKNVVAIGAGMAIGMGLGDSARSALMTRGFAEIVRLAERRGAVAQTLFGLSGFGDLVLTCTSPQSRNYSHGLAIGAGQEVDPSKTVEGVMTAHAVAEDTTAEDMPVTHMVSAVLKEQITLEEAVNQLLARPQRHEWR